MFKVAIVSLLLTVVVNAQDATESPFDDIVQAANSGNWDKFQDLLYKKFGANGWKNINLDNIRNLKPPSGGHVYGESQYTFHSSLDNGNQKKVETGGHKIVNDDGKVKEYDFKPNFDENPLLSLQKQFDSDKEFGSLSNLPSSSSYLTKPTLKPQVYDRREQGSARSINYNPYNFF